MSKTKKKKKEKTYDVVDIYKKLRKHFPYLNFIIEEVVKPIGRDNYTFHKFSLRRYNGQLFEPAVKTTISILKNNEITKEEYQTIRANVALSFPKTR